MTDERICCLDWFRWCLWWAVVGEKNVPAALFSYINSACKVSADRHILIHVVFSLPEHAQTLPASSMPESHIVRRDPGRGDGMVSSEMFGANEAPNSSRGSKISTNLDGRKPAFSSSGGFSASEVRSSLRWY